jgi:hypothetical protein
MQKFEYRTPRYLVDLPVRFKLPNASVAGRCMEIGKEGMRVQLQEHVDTNTCGTVSIQYRDLALDLRVCVAHAGSDFKGLRFLFESDKDRAAVEHLVSLVAGNAGPSGPVLVR